jgi:Zn-dependent protease
MGSDLAFGLLIGFGGFRLTQLWKEVMARYGWYQPAWWKTLLSLAICLTLAVTVIPHRSMGIRLVVGLGASGLAAIWHAIDTLLRSYRDKTVTEVMSRNRVRPR